MRDAGFLVSRLAVAPWKLESPDTMSQQAAAPYVTKLGRTSLRSIILGRVANHGLVAKILAVASGESIYIYIYTHIYIYIYT